VALLAQSRLRLAHRRHHTDRCRGRRPPGVQTEEESSRWCGHIALTFTSPSSQTHCSRPHDSPRTNKRLWRSIASCALSRRGISSMGCRPPCRPQLQPKRQRAAPQLPLVVVPVWLTMLCKVSWIDQWCGVMRLHCSMKCRVRWMGWIGAPVSSEEARAGCDLFVCRPSRPDAALRCVCGLPS